MVSSTFYDLRQIRDDLRRFIEDQLGYSALLSEHASFPVDPDLTTIENCRQRVEHDANALVLIIGSKYGSIDDRSAKSITNLEYLAARRKGIPIFAFVDQALLPLLPVWTANPDADFSGQVDNSKLFEFVDTVRGSHKVWTHEFKTAQDIIDALRIQFAYQHERGLRLQQRLRSIDGLAWAESLRGEALSLLLERPDGWEVRLFLAVMTEAVNKHYRARSHHRQRVALGLGEDVDNPLAWVARRFSDARRLVATAETLINGALQNAFSPVGVTGDAEAITLIAESIGQIYADALTWHNRVMSANLDVRFDPVRRSVAQMLDDVIEQLESFGPQAQATYAATLAAVPDGKTETLNLVLKIKIPDGVVERINAELDRLSGSGL